MSNEIKMTQKGEFNRTLRFLSDAKNYKAISYKILDRYGKEGVQALAAYTPKDTGLTSESWNYRIEDNGKSLRIVWYNTNVSEGWANVAVLIQYGHGTKNGGYVEGVDYINPAMNPIFEKIEKSIWEEVVKYHG